MNEFELAQTHIQLLRKAVIFWDATEGGAPFIGAYGDSIEGLFSDVGSLLGLPALEKDPYTKNRSRPIEGLIMEMGTVLQIALSCGTIEVGDYSYPNPLLAFYPDETEVAASEIYLEDYGATGRRQSTLHCGRDISGCSDGCGPAGWIMRG